MHAIRLTPRGWTFVRILLGFAAALIVAASAQAFTITVSPVPTHGTVTTSQGGINCGTGGAACVSSDIPGGTMVTMSALPDVGYSFDQWSPSPGPGLDHTNPLFFPIPSDLTGTAFFVAVPITVSSVTPALKTLVLGDPLTLTVTVSAAPLSDTVITVDAQPVGVVSVPGSVMVLAGQTTATIPVTTIANGSVLVSASIGASNAGSSITVIPTATVPGAPQLVSATAGDTQATVNFVPPDSDGGTPITSYTATSSPDGITASGAGAPIVVTGLTNGTSYSFTVFATNSVGDSAPSAPSGSVLVGGTVPGAPDLCSASVSGNLTVTVDCFAAAPDGGNAITSYTATSSPGGLTGTASGPSIAVSGLTRGVDYTFTVTATNVRGTGPASSPTNSVTAIATPGAPTGVTAVAGDGIVTLNWTAPVDDGGSPITKFTVRSSLGGTPTDATTTPFIIASAVGVPATFTVTASNQAGEGPQSTPSNSATPTASLAGAPTRVHAMAGDARATVSFLAPASNGGAAITSYVVTSSPGGITASGAHSPIDVTGLSNGTPYTFTVAAVNIAGTGPSSSASNIVLPATVGARTSPRAYITNSGDALVAVIDTATNRVITTIPVGLGPSGVAVNGAGTRAYVANAGDNTVSVIDTTANSVVATIPVGANPEGVAVNPAGTRVYVTNISDNTVSVINTATNAVIATVPGIQVPTSVVVHPSGSPAYVTSASGLSLAQIDGTSNAALSPIPLGLFSPSTVALAPGGGSVYVGGSGAAGNVATVVGGSVIGTVTGLAGVVSAIAVSPTTGREYASIPSTNQVAVIDGVTLAGAVNVGASPSGLAVTPSGNRVYVSNTDDGTVTVIDTSNNTVVTTIPVGVQPMGFGLFIGPEPISVPGAPGAVVATGGNAQATVAFVPPGFDGGGPITSYTATSSPGGITASAASSPIVVTGLTNGTTYTFTVTATNSAGTGPASLPSNAVTPKTVPDAPSSVSALAGDTQATISFFAPANGGSSITSYTVTCVPGPVQATGGASPIVVTGLVNSTLYACTVTATNAAGTGAASSAANVTPLATSTTSLVSSAPSAVSGTPVTLTATVNGAAGTPTGSVTFRDGAVDLATVALNGSGQAAFTTSSLAAGSHSITASYAGSSAYAASTSSGVAITITSPDPTRLGNISTRMQVLTGNNVLIAGFIIGGSSSKTVAITATGPSLVPFGITNPLANPTMTLVRQSDHAVIATNDDWQTDANASLLQATGFAPTNPLESGLYVTLAPGAYTAIVSGVGGGTGVSVVGVFEIDHPEIPLVNISTRGEVLTGNDVMIGGFIVYGSAPQTVAITATGPSLVPFGITNPLANPTLTLVRQSDHAVIATNDDWQSDPNASLLQATGFAPTNPLESGLYVTLPPGAYTAIVSGAGGGVGVSVIGVFTVP